MTLLITGLVLLIISGVLAAIFILPGIRTDRDARHRREQAR